LHGETGWRSENHTFGLGTLKSYDIFWKTLSNCSLQKGIQINLFSLLNQVTIGAFSTQNRFKRYGLLGIENTKDNVNPNQYKPEVSRISEETQNLTHRERIKHILGKILGT